MRPNKFGLTAHKDVIDNCISFRLNKLLKFTVLALFGDFSADIWIKQKLHITFRPCYETKIFAKKTLSKKIYEVDIVNELFLISWSNIKLFFFFR